MIVHFCHAALAITLMGSLTCILAGYLYAYPPVIISGTVLLVLALGIQFVLILLEFQSFRNSTAVFAVDETTDSPH